MERLGLLSHKNSVNKSAQGNEAPPVDVYHFFMSCGLQCVEMRRAVDGNAT